MKNIKYIIFDMDGVLVDSENAIRAACIEMFKRRGHAAEPDDFIPFTGMVENRFIGGVAEKYGLAFEPSMKAEAYAIYAEIADEYIIVYEGIKDLIPELKKRGYKIAVASAADEIKVNVNLKCIGLTAADFDGVVTGSDVTKHKPDPEAFLKACAKINGVPGECLVVEDAEAGCMAAKAAGMYCAGVPSTFSKQALINAGADIVIQKTVDLLTHL